MSRWKGLAARARSILRPGDAEVRLDEEFRFHLETETEHLIREGVPPAEARRRALVAFGAVEGDREAMRDERGARWFETCASTGATQSKGCAAAGAVPHAETAVPGRSRPIG
jgi:hypothetical protein